MSDKKNLDRLFQEKFKDYEVDAPSDAWTNIEARLNNNERKRRIIPFWLQFSGVAAALVLGWFVFQNFFSNSDIDNGVVNQEQNNGTPKIIENQDPLFSPISSDKNDSDGKSSSASANDQIVVTGPPSSSNNIESSDLNSNRNNEDNLDSQNKNSKSEALPHSRMRSNRKNFNLNPATENSSNKLGSQSEQRLTELNGQSSQGKSERSDTTLSEDNIIGTPKSNQQVAQNSSLESSQLDKNKIATDIQSIAEKVDTTAIATVVPNSLEELLNEKENNVTTKEQKVNRWQISSNVAPIYFSSTSDGSPIDPQFSDKKKDYKQNLSYGVGVRYAINKKLSIRAGVNSIGMEYTTNDAVFYQTANAKPLAHVDQNLQGSALQIESKGASQGLELTPNANLMQKFDATINQRTGYYELPVELSYKLLDKKFGVELIGGMSTLFLNENVISMTSSGTTMDIGQANNLNSTHFSTNFGVGVKYNFLRSFQLNLEPMIKYQLNTFNDSGNYQPFFFGVYTGINYRF